MNSDETAVADEPTDSIGTTGAAAADAIGTTGVDAASEDGDVIEHTEQTTDLFTMPAND